MQIQENFNIQRYNTFGINAIARKFATINAVKELPALVRQAEGEPLLVLGGGSNLLFTEDFHGLVLKNNLKGIRLLKEDSKHYYVQVAAGEPWHSFVMYCVERGYAGLENLSLIPGLAGASPMQNIGAYGVEIKDYFHELEAYNIREEKIQRFSSQQCQFGYRESVFKKALKGQYIILSVTFRLLKHPELHLDYGAIKTELAAAGIDLSKRLPSIKEVSSAVIRIRESKLPDPANTGNAGSFFKNPTIPLAQYESLKERFEALPGYPVPDSKPSAAAQIKVAAGYLIEACGFKGYRKGDAGVHNRQALVLVNYGKATGREIYQLSEQIIESVYEKFSITLEREVNII